MIDLSAVGFTAQVTLVFFREDDVLTHACNVRVLGISAIGTIDLGFLGVVKMTGQKY